MKKKLFVMISLALILTTIVVTALAHIHSYGNWVFIRYPTCTREGKQERKCKCGYHDRRLVAKVPHDYKPATCTKPKVCKFNCGATKGSPLGHNYGIATCVAPRTCVRCGKTMGGLGAHNFTNATCTQVSKCRICGVPTGTYAPHNYVDGRCKVCGRIQPAIME